MNVPMLRKTIRLPHFPAVAIAVRSVLPFDERRVDLATARRRFQRGFHLLRRAEHPSIIDLRHSPLRSRFMNRRINKAWLRSVTRSSRTSSTSSPFGHSFLTERLQNRFFVRLVPVARHQSRNTEFQALSRSSDQQFRIRLRSLAVDDLQHELVLGIQGDVVPIVTASGVSRIVFVAVFLFLFHEVPLLVELNLLRFGGKRQRVHHGVVRRVPRRSVHSVRRFDNPLRSVVPSCEARFPRRDARRWRRLVVAANANRRAGFPAVRKISFCKPGNRVSECRCFSRTRFAAGYYLPRERRVSGSFYSHNKSFSSRP